MLLSFKKAIILLQISIFLSLISHSISFIWCLAMGNALRFLYVKCCQPLSQESESLGPHGVTTATIGVTAIAHDLFQFDITSQVTIVPFAIAIFIFSCIIWLFEDLGT